MAKKTKKQSWSAEDKKQFESLSYTKKLKNLNSVLMLVDCDKNFDNVAIGEVQKYLSNLLYKHAGIGYSVISNKRLEERLVTLELKGMPLRLCYQLLKTSAN